MIPKSQIKLFYLIAVVFILINCYLIVAKEILWFNLAPIAIIIFLGLFYSIDKVLMTSVFFVPFSVPLNRYVFDSDFNIDLPTEPIFILITIVFILKQLKDHDFDKRILYHPVSITIFIYIIWKAITCFTSSMPIVSIKNIIMMSWFIVPFYFLMTQIVRKHQNINKFFWLYIISFCGVITYTLFIHSKNNFSQAFANYAMKPFLNDHTSYGAVLAMYIPIIIGLIFNKDLKKKLRIISGVVLLYFFIAIVLSYTRAAWLSLIGALAVYIVLKLKINYKVVISTVIVALGLFFIFQDQIFFKLENNKQDSSSDITEHIKSISNVATDASNVERINRWNCAIRMFKERPIFGWGPGTYQFIYGPFQYSYEKTIVSSNTGNLGNAHSEYLGTLSESGIIGLISFVLIIGTILVTAFKAYYKAKSNSLKIIIASTICGLVTYFIHGFLNNFLDMDKIAIPFWGFTAIIVAIDVYHIGNEKDITKEDITKID